MLGVGVGLAEAPGWCPATARSSDARVRGRRRTLSRRSGLMDPADNVREVILLLPAMAMRPPREPWLGQSEETGAILHGVWVAGQ